MTIKTFRKRLERLDLPKLAEKAFNKVKNDAKEVLQQQWNKGEGGNGDFPKYSKNSVEKFGKPSGSWKLYDSGKLSRGIYFKASNGMVESFSKDSKADMIEAKLSGHYAPLGTGKDYAPFKMNNESRRIFNVYLQSSFINEIKNVLFK